MKTLKIEPSNIRAAFTPNSFNQDDYTIEIVFATETEVPRRTWDGTNWIEILECSNSAVRLDRLNAGANLIDTHHTYTVKDIIGVVERAWIEGNQGKAIVRLSKRADVASTVEGIIEGVIRNISVGYKIHKAEQTEDSDNNIITVRIKDWEPMELTVCAVPADFKAGTRSETPPANYTEIEITSNRNMETNNTSNTEASAERSAQNASNASPAPVTTPASTASTDTDAVRTAVLAERTRVEGIQVAYRAANIDDQELLDTLIRTGASFEAASAKIVNKLAEMGNSTNTRHQAPITLGADETDKRREAMTVALMHRADPSVTLIAGAADFRGLTLIELARECAELAGIKTRGMSQREVAESALNTRGMHSTSDFPIILGNTVNRVLRAEYEIQERTFAAWASRGSAKDFREMTRVSLGEVGDFKEVKEGGEYEYTTLGEGKESYKVVKFGQKIAITWETLVNDDLSAFSRIPRKIAAAAARKQSDIVYAILTGSHLMSDGKELFHADHKNLATGAAINIDSMGLMRKLLRKQKGLDGKDVLNLTPKFVICGPDYEQIALQYTSSNYVANTPGNDNVWKGSVMPIIEDRIAGNAWFFAANPSQIDTIEYSFLEGEPELFTEQRNGFDVDGLEIKARMVFGAKAIDFRGLAKNPGA